MEKLQRLKIRKTYNIYGEFYEYEIYDSVTDETLEVAFATEEEALVIKERLEYIANTNYLGEGSYANFKKNGQLLKQ